MLCMLMDDIQNDAYKKISQEMRRGLLILATLSELKVERYGYDLIDRLSAQGLAIDQGTLYPLLRRLESQELLDSRWDTEGSRPRRYYRISASGRIVLEALEQEWQALAAIMDHLLTPQGDNNHGPD
jgi:PadR family transcriptional regulator, regulatory protein PadR